MDSLNGYGTTELKVEQAQLLLRTNEGLVMGCAALCIGITASMQHPAMRVVDNGELIERVLPKFEEYLTSIISNEERYMLLPEYRAELLKGFTDTVCTIIVEIVERKVSDEEAKPSV